MDQIGGAFDDKGLNLRDKPDGTNSQVICNLPFGTRFLIEAELPGGWYKVRVLGGGNGYVSKGLVSIAPEPGAQLHKIQGGESAIGIAERFYKQAVKPGEDLRFFVNVLSYVNPKAIAKPAQDDSWKKATSLKDYAIWVPSAEFALTLRDKVGSGSITGGLWATVRDAAAYVIRTLIEQLPGGQRVLTWLERVGKKIAHVFIHPGRFLENLVESVKKGFHQFTSNIVTNIEESLLSLLTGSLAGQGITVPAKLDATGVLSLGLDVLGINQASLEEKLFKQGIPRGTLRRIEKVGELGSTIADIQKHGLAPTLRKFFENADALKETVFSTLKEWILTQVIKQGLAVLASIFIPGAGLIQLAIKIYDTVMFIINKMEMIKKVVISIVDSLSNIVDGKVDDAAKKIENSLKLGLTLGLGFLANIAKLGSIAQKVKEIISRLRKAVDNALDKLVQFIASKARPLLDRVSSKKPNASDTAPTTQPTPRSKREHDAKVYGGLKQIEVEETKIDRDNDRRLTKNQATQVAETIQKNNPIFKKINVLYDVQHNTITYEWFASHGEQPSSRKPYIDELEPEKNEGTKENPFSIQWLKPASNGYPTLYFGGYRKEIVSQKELRQLEGKPDTNGVTVKAYKPHEHSVLPGGEQIGISPQYQLSAGTLLGPIPSVKSIINPGGRLINSILEKYGYKASYESLDGDHIHELQLGGAHEIGNLWPLEKEVNKKSGETIQTMDIRLANNKVITMQKLRTLVAKTGRKFYFKVGSVAKNSNLAT